MDSQQPAVADVAVIVQRGEIVTSAPLCVPEAASTDIPPIVVRTITREAEVPLPPSAIEVSAEKPPAEDEGVQIKSVGDAVNFLLNPNPENARRAEEMDNEQALRFEGYSDEKSVLSFIPSGIGKGIDTMSNAVQAVIPVQISNAAQAAGDQFTKVAERAADVINSAPSLVINTIPNSLMSQKTKQLIFVD